MQPGPRAPLAPAETLLEPAVLRALATQATVGDATTIAGSDPAMGEIAITCVPERCTGARDAMRKVQGAIASKAIDAPLRSIRLVSTIDATQAPRLKAAIHVADTTDRPLQVIRGMWSTAGIGDEVVEVFARHVAAGVEARPYEPLGQLPLDPFGVSTTTVVSNPSMSSQVAATVAAQAAYFLATLPNGGAEALLSHLTVGAHARLAEDGRKAVAQMGPQQRASADVLIMFGQAIDREQRRMRSFERFMPSPVDPMLHTRIADMEKGITSVWTSMGITSAPFVPPAERIRGRGGEDRRVPTRRSAGPIAPVEAPTAFLRFDHPDVILYELGNFIDGVRSVSDIRDAVSAEFGALPFPSVVDYFDRLAARGAITLR